ncbi:iron-siderophore ABC transporter substrate-binding protein [Microlunatus sp. GCM10028923]|uniref:iron-siderophore ABC transporter substrate-binding protein n=1 Tax=Microlunatus sp. GCM10028923 TaxID=3273400 RepID=UPI0036073835
MPLPHRLRSTLVALIGSTLITVLAVACSSTPTAGPGAGAAEDGFPVRLSHAFGTITVEQRPQRIVTLGEDLDTLAALGITPVAYAPTAPGYSDDVPYLKDRIDLSGATVLDGAETGEFKIEQIAAAAPDLILASNFYGMPELYDELSKIAPTLAYATGWGETSWQELSATIGRAAGEEDRARAAVAETEQYLADLRADLPALEGKTVAGAYYHSSGTFAANPRSASMQKYTALGLRVNPPLLEALPEGASDNSVSRETMDVLDADLLILSYGSDALRSELEADPIFRRLKAVRSGTIYVNDPTDRLPTFAGNNPTLLNIVWLLEQQRETLAKVR